MSYGRDVATCWIGRTEINRTMAGEGLAVAYSRYTRRYIPIENAAKAAKRGIWAGTMELPHCYRNPRAGNCPCELPACDHH